MSIDPNIKRLHIVNTIDLMLTVCSSTKRHMQTKSIYGRNFDKTDYRFLLFNEFERRRQKNSRYSIRGFAASLGVSNAYLSLVFSGKRELTKNSAVNFLDKLKWPRPRAKLFLALIEYQRAPTPELKEQAFSEIQDLEELDFLELGQDEFRYLSEPHHFALAELSVVKGFRNNPTWIAKRLGITKQQAVEALGRLSRLKIFNDEKGQLTKKKVHYRIKDGSSEAIRSFHLSNLKAAQTALKMQGFENRDFSGLTIAINKKKLPEIKELIRNFRSRLNSYSSSMSDKDAVYQLSVQFFRLDKEGEK